MTKEYIYDKKEGFKGYKADKKTSICLGFFDGLHLGHLHIVEEAKKISSEVSLLTFDGSIKFVLSRREKNEVLTSIEDRREILSKEGVNNLFVVDFNEDIINMDPVDFIDKILKPLNIDTVFVGSDFRFGYKAEGDVKLLTKYFDVHVVDFVYADKEHKISSTMIIDIIHLGEVKKANELLGRDYSLTGSVVRGLGNGHKLGFPTSNIKPSFPYVIPKKGVYATKITIDGKDYLSMTDIGVHPTIEELTSSSIETNVFNNSEDLYGKTVKLTFLDFIREEKKFSSVDELKEQLTKDRDYIKSHY